MRLYLSYLREEYSEPQTIMRKRDALKGFYNYLHEEKLVARTPSNLLERIRIERKPPPFLNETDAARLIDTIEANPALCEVIPGGNGGWFNHTVEAKFLAVRDRAMLETIYSCGLRAAETVGLNWVDIDFRAVSCGSIKARVVRIASSLSVKPRSIDSGIWEGLP